MKKIKYFEAILELTKEKSLNTISVRDIANHLELSTGSLYYQFNGKSDLLNQMFIYYKQQIDDHMKDIDNDYYQFFSTYLSYNIEHNLEFRFIYSSELANLLSPEALKLSLDIHLNLLKKLGLDYYQDSHMITIIFGTMRAYLMAPSYMVQCDADKLARELVTILNNYKSAC